MNISIPLTLPFPTPPAATGSPTQPVANAPVTATDEITKTPAPTGNGVLPLDNASALSDAAGTKFKVNQAANIKDRFMNLMDTVNKSAAKMMSGLNLDDEAQSKVDKALGKFEKSVMKELGKLMDGEKTAEEVAEKLEKKLDKLTEKLGKIINHALEESDEVENDNHDDDRVEHDDHDRGHHGDHHKKEHDHHERDHDDHDYHDDDDDGVNLPPVVSYPGTPISPRTPVVPTKASPATPIVDPSATPSLADANGFTAQPVANPPVEGPVTMTPTVGPDIAQDSPVSSIPTGVFNLDNAMSAFQSATGDALNQFLDALTQFGPSLIGPPSIASYGQTSAFAPANLTPGVGVDQVA